MDRNLKPLAPYTNDKQETRYLYKGENSTGTFRRLYGYHRPTVILFTGVQANKLSGTRVYLKNITPYRFANRETNQLVQ
jgi:hypothetical protein